MEAIMKTKAITGVCAMTALAVSAAPGGTVSFDPPVREVDPSISTVTTFEVGIGASTVGSFDAIDMIIGSDELALTDWEPNYPCPFGIPCWQSDDAYPSAIKFGFFGPSNPAAGFQLGTLTVDAAGLPVGTYTVHVDAARDGGRSLISGGGESEPLYGVGTVQVIPDPATAVLLGLAVLVIGCRRGPRAEPYLRFKHRPLAGGRLAP